MNRVIRLASAVLLAAAGLVNAQAAILTADGNWQRFDVDQLSAVSFGTEWIDIQDSTSPSYGTPLSFKFTIAVGQTGTLTVLDIGYAGDTFNIFNGVDPLAPTSSMPNPMPIGIYPGVPGIDDPDLAFADPSFWRATFI